MTSYRHVRHSKGRGWITIDGEEIHNFCSLRYEFEAYVFTTQMRYAGAPGDRQKAHELLEEVEIVPQYWFEQSLQEYLSLSISDALDSTNFLHRALAMLDSRLGLRRLRQLDLGREHHHLVHLFYRLRTAAEGLTPRPSAA